jgi:hypothetical protein
LSGSLVDYLRLWLLLLVYADDVNLLRDTIRKNTETLTDDNKDVGLEAKREN